MQIQKSRPPQQIRRFLTTHSSSLKLMMDSIAEFLNEEKIDITVSPNDLIMNVYVKPAHAQNKFEAILSNCIISSIIHIKRATATL